MNEEIDFELDFEAPTEVITEDEIDFDLEATEEIDFDLEATEEISSEVELDFNFENISEEIPEKPKEASFLTTSIEEALKSEIPVAEVKEKIEEEVGAMKTTPKIEEEVGAMPPTPTPEIKEDKPVVENKKKTTKKKTVTETATTESFEPTVVDLNDLDSYLPKNEEWEIEKNGLIDVVDALEQPDDILDPTVLLDFSRKIDKAYCSISMKLAKYEAISKTINGSKKYPGVITQFKKTQESGRSLDAKKKSSEEALLVSNLPSLAQLVEQKLIFYTTVVNLIDNKRKSLTIVQSVLRAV